MFRPVLVAVCVGVTSLIGVGESEGAMTMETSGTVLTLTITEGTYSTTAGGVLRFGTTIGATLIQTPSGAFDVLGGGTYSFASGSSPHIEIYYDGSNEIVGIYLLDPLASGSVDLVGGAMTVDDPWFATLVNPVAPLALTGGTFSGIDSGLSSVPEPSAAVMLCVGALALSRRRRSV